MAIQPKVIALGFFDGVHLGHGALLRRTAAEAKRRGVRSAVFTWAQPPKEVVSGVPVPLINSPEDRAWLAKNLYGIDEVIMVPFDHEMMTTSWEDFITEILVKRYHAVHLVAGSAIKIRGRPLYYRQNARNWGWAATSSRRSRWGVSLSALPISAGWWDLDRWSGPWTIWAILTS